MKSKFDKWFKDIVKIDKKPYALTKHTVKILKMLIRHRIEQVILKSHSSNDKLFFQLNPQSVQKVIEEFSD